MSQQTASGSDPSEKPENAPVSRRTIDPERMDSLSFSFNHDQLRIDNTRKEIATVVTVLSRLESERENMDSSVHDADLITNLEKDATLRGHLRKLRNKLNLLEWRAFASSKSLVALDPMVVDRLLDIQKETASSVGALAALGASLSLSILYSGTRGGRSPFLLSLMISAHKPIGRYVGLFRSLVVFHHCSGNRNIPSLVQCCKRLAIRV
ncbi:uncharacterized protein EI90DRAFT_1637765 [Cantharellus anzutake]|uniref:uncharacterized protein n=1 Tax=Cantharellus anzutake TaxID=1750568 RepID=UPI00190843E7|nr:uncharacterized protein EI90DRAFT_1637765 [Cantharellus anzutake]KAF8327881.1 hypothetical protein EI90DRAFT_1637765 [Cantharellus anzutake]